jgi:hypothetical protein
LGYALDTNLVVVVFWILDKAYNITTERVNKNLTEQWTVPIERKT